jgi:hypothetical protein
MLQIILDFLQKVPGGMDRIKKQNQEELFLGAEEVLTKGSASKRTSGANLAKDDRISKLFSYPSSVTGKFFSQLLILYKNIHDNTMLKRWFCRVFMRPFMDRKSQVSLGHLSWI